MPTEETEAIDSEGRALAEFVTAYQDALAQGRPLPTPEALPAASLVRWERMRTALHLLARTAPLSREGVATPALDQTRPVNFSTPLRQCGRYQLIRELGRGGMGVVHLARDPDLDRLVAIKMIAPGGRDEGKRLFRFEAEGRLLARQRHPNIVQVFETGEEQGQPYLVMEFVDGPSLSQQLAGRPMKPRAAAEMLEALARAVGHAHQAGILHRDLKPANVLLAADGTPKISDFGLATTLEAGQALTRTGEVVGTPVYMAPEMATISGSKAGPSVDVYGLGAILYEALTGQPPFMGVDALLILTQVLHADPVPPRQVAPQVPADLQTICQAAMAKDARKRYATAEALADDLKRFLEGRPILARPAGPIERAAKFARRRPAVATAVGIAAAALVAVVSIVLSYNVELKEERDRAVRGEKSALKAQEKTADTLVELSVTLGLSAEKAHNLPEAALWFAVAARQSRPGCEASRINATRWQTYTAASPVPWRAIQMPEADRLMWLGLHPSVRWLITTTESTWTLWDLEQEKRIAWPGEARTVTAAAWSPDGRFLATGSRQGEVHLFRFPEGELAGRSQAKGPIENLTFDPAGKRLVSVDGSHRLQLRALGESLPVLLEQEHPERIFAIAFSPSGTRLSTLCDSARAFVIDVEGNRPRLLLGPVRHGFTRVSHVSDEGPGFLSDDELVTTDKQEITVWDLSTGKVKKTFPGGTYREGGIAVSARGQYVLSWRHLQEPELWQTADERAAADRTVRSPPAESVAIRPDGGRLLLGSKNGLQVWNRDRSPASGVLWHHGAPHPLTWSADGRWFASAGNQGIVRLWRAQDDRPIAAQLPVPPQGASPIVFTLSPDGGQVMTATTRDGQAQFQLSTLDGKPVGPCVRLTGQPTGVVFSPDGNIVYAVTTSTPRGWLHAWYRDTGKPAFPGIDLPYPPYDVACRPDGAALALTGGERSDVELRSAINGALISNRQTADAIGEPIFVADRVRFAPDGRTFISFGRSDRVWEWNARDGSFLRHFALPKDKRCVDARYSADGRYLASASTNGHSAIVWDLRDGTRAATLAHPDFVFSARFDPEGKRLVTACRDGKTRVWDWSAGALAIPALSQSEEVTDAAFSPDGRWIASAEAGGRARIWDASLATPLAPGWLLQSPGAGFPYFANRVEFSKDGRQLLVGVRRHHLLVFDLTQLTTPTSADRSPDEMVQLAEINAGMALRSGGTAEPLTGAQWLERWQNFRRGDPMFHGWPAGDRRSK